MHVEPLKQSLNILMRIDPCNCSSTRRLISHTEFAPGILNSCHLNVSTACGNRRLVIYLDSHTIWIYIPVVGIRISEVNLNLTIEIIDSKYTLVYKNQPSVYIICLYTLLCRLNQCTVTRRVSHHCSYIIAVTHCILKNCSVHLKEQREAAQIGSCPPDSHWNVCVQGGVKAQASLAGVHRSVASPAQYFCLVYFSSWHQTCVKTQFFTPLATGGSA